MVSFVLQILYKQNFNLNLCIEPTVALSFTLNGIHSTLSGILDMFCECTCLFGTPNSKLP